MVWVVVRARACLSPSIAPSRLELVLCLFYRAHPVVNVVLVEGALRRLLIGFGQLIIVIHHGHLLRPTRRRAPRSLRRGTAPYT